LNVSTPSGDSHPFLSIPAHGRAIGSFWRRLLAFIVDAILVGIVGGIIAIPFSDAFCRMGNWGRLVGFCIALPYYAIFNSVVGKGQTIGKRLLSLEVVDARGSAISLETSFLRYAVFSIPFILNGIILPAQTPWIISNLIYFVLFATIAGTFYLVCFNRNTRQGIHDLAVGTYVVESGNPGPIRIVPIWKSHWIILGSILVVVSVTAALILPRIEKSGPFPEMMQDIRLLQDLPNVESVGVQDLRSAPLGGRESTSTFVININWTGEPADEEEFAGKVADLVRQRDPNVNQHDNLAVVIIRGYNLGIASRWTSRRFEYPLH
jgi:uncharacterized RDD family membrane protein YckC